MAKEDTKRVACDLPGAGDVIDGVAFTQIKLADVNLAVSDPLTPAQYERFLSIEGFRPAPPAAEPLVAQAAAARLAAAKVQADEERQAAAAGVRIADLEKANAAIAADLRAERERCERLAAENVKLATENKRLKADGLRAVPGTEAKVEGDAK